MRRMRTEVMLGQPERVEPELLRTHRQLDTFPQDRSRVRITCCVGQHAELRPVRRPPAGLIPHPAILGVEGDSVPRVPGGFLDPDVEAIIGYQPDLVIGPEDAIVIVLRSWSSLAV